MKRLLIVLVAFVNVQALSFAAEAPPHGCPTAVYHYVMNGQVRLLLFWVGREGVGGGSISFLSGKDTSYAEEVTGVQVIFGSIPECVPGKINRWGFGREWSFWREASPGSRELQKTIFEGFMRHSGEGSLAEVQNPEKRNPMGSLYWYDAISSIVQPHSASSTIRVFSDVQDFDFRMPDSIQRVYESTVKRHPPDRSRKLENRDRLYKEPQGFLSGLHRMIGESIATFDPVKAQQWKPFPSSTVYVYNSSPYRLTLSKARYERGFQIPRIRKDAGEAVSECSFSHVAKLDFSIRNLEVGNTHDFTIWVALTGDLRGVPLRIVDKPRWWLRVELVLDLSRTRALSSGTGIAFQVPSRQCSAPDGIPVRELRSAPASR